MKFKVWKTADDGGAGIAAAAYLPCLQPRGYICRQNTANNSNSNALSLPLYNQCDATTRHHTLAGAARPFGHLLSRLWVRGIGRNHRHRLRRLLENPVGWHRHRQRPPARATGRPPFFTRFTMATGPGYICADRPARIERRPHRASRTGIAAVWPRPGDPAANRTT